MKGSCYSRVLSGLIAELSTIPVVQTQVSVYLRIGFRRVGGSAI